MARPALVIGLGGTGQWVLTYLKKNLIEIGNGTFPRNVRLLCYDTTSRSSTNLDKRISSDEEDIRAGAVRLIENQEFYSFGRNLSPLMEAISKGKLPHLDWFPADSFLSKLPVAAFNLSEGSGQIRHLGRLALFNDLSNGPTSIILGTIQNAFGQISNEVNYGEQLEIIVIGSLAGGTGAGILIDTGLILHEIASRFAAWNYRLSGFFVLPRFSSQREMLARMYATWRELDRFLLTGLGSGQQNIYYSATDPSLRMLLRKRLYDVSYLVDSVREASESETAVGLERTVFPTIATAISAMLDSKAGTAYTEVTVNLSARRAQLPRKPYHSIIGSHSVKAYSYWTRDKLIYQLVLETITRLLALEFDTNGKPSHVSELKNEETRDDAFHGAQSFLRLSNLQTRFQNIPNTRFLPLIAETQQRNMLEKKEWVHKTAAGGAGSSLRYFLEALTDIGQTEEGRLIVRDIANELEYSLLKEVPPSRDHGSTPDEDFQRILKEIERFRQEHYGIVSTNDKPSQGKYREALKRAASIQIKRFHELLQAWTIDALNGRASDPFIARCGKVGYVRAVHIELIKTFRDFVDFVNEVKKVRDVDLKIALASQETARRARREYTEKRDKKSLLTFWDRNVHPQARTAEQEYLWAEARDIDIAKDSILLDILTEIAVRLVEATAEYLASLEKWIDQLALGHTNPLGSSIYDAALKSLRNIQLNQDLDKRLQKVNTIVGEPELPISQMQIAEILKFIEWDFRHDRDAFSLVCGIRQAPDKINIDSELTPLSIEGRESAKDNLNLLLPIVHTVSRLGFGENSFFQELIKTYPSAGALAQAVADKTQPFYVRSTASEGARMTTYHIQVPADRENYATEYFQDFVNQMQYVTNLGKFDIRLADAENQNGMTILRSDHLLPSEDFQLWDECRRAYISLITDPHTGVSGRELHVFREEINASKIELELPRVLRRNYQIFHPDVVALLYDIEKVNLFLICWAFGFINFLEGSYTLKNPDGRINVTFWKKTNYSEFDFDVFEAINNFLALDINWDVLKAAITEHQDFLGRTRTIMLFRKQLEEADGIIALVRNALDRKRSLISDSVFRKSVGQEFEDLIVLIEYFYHRAVDASYTVKSTKKDIISFAERAEFSVRRYKYPNIVKMIPVGEQWKTRFDRPILGCQIWDTALDEYLLSKLIQQVEDIREHDKDVQDIVLLALDRPPDQRIVSEIYRFRAEKGIRIIIMGEDIFAASDDKIPLILEDYLFDNLGPQRDLYEQRIPVSDPLHFFGREQIVNEFNQRLINGELIGLFGIRKIGKSSLLRYIQRNANFPVAYLDLQARQKSSDIFLRALQQWYESPIRLALQWQPNMNLSENPEQIFIQEVQALRERSMKDGRGLPALFLDEIELIFPSAQSTEEDIQHFMAFARVIRGLVQEGQMSAIFAGVDATINHINRIGKLQNPFYQALIEKYLGPISEKDCKEMIVAIGLRMGLSYTNESLDEIVRLSGGHPFFARILCSTVFQIRQRRRGEVSLEDIERATQPLISQPNTAILLNEQGLWGEMTDPKLWGRKLSKEMKFLLTDLAQENLDQNQSGMLKSRIDALYQLTQRGVVRQANGKYSIQMKLFQNWIKRYILGSDI
jgi:hypothetical protein